MRILYPRGRAYLSQGWVEVEDVHSAAIFHLYYGVCALFLSSSMSPVI